jgi:hypothetical protein
MAIAGDGGVQEGNIGPPGVGELPDIGLISLGETISMKGFGVMKAL